MISLTIFNAVRSVSTPARPTQPANDKGRDVLPTRKSA
jgi:hypothetical protein